MNLHNFKHDGKVAPATGASCGSGNTAVALSKTDDNIVGIGTENPVVTGYINNLILGNDVIEFTENQWDTVLDLLPKTLVFLTQEIMAMIARGFDGKITIIASLMSFQGGIRVTSCTASQSGINELTSLWPTKWHRMDSPPMRLHQVPNVFFERASKCGYQDGEQYERFVL